MDHKFIPVVIGQELEHISKFIFYGFNDVIATVRNNHNNLKLEVSYHILISLIIDEFHPSDSKSNMSDNKKIIPSKKKNTQQEKPVSGTIYQKLKTN